MPNPISAVDTYITIDKEPFPHFITPMIFNEGITKAIYQWLHNNLQWSLTEADFYTQFEFSILHTSLPESLFFLRSKETLDQMKMLFKKAMDVNNLQLTEITAHKLTHGHHIGIHNDHINKEETHRITIQINSGWKEDNGGFLLLFHSALAEDVSKIVLPSNNSAFGFQISAKSYHAVSTIYNFSRYSLVYTFKEV